MNKPNISNMSQQELHEYSDELIAQLIASRTTERNELVDVARAAVYELQTRGCYEVQLADLERRHAETLRDLERRRAQACGATFLIPQAE